jgi:hypothetical protein
MIILIEQIKPSYIDASTLAETQYIVHKYQVDFSIRFNKENTFAGSFTFEKELTCSQYAEIIKQTLIALFNETNKNNE